MHISSLRIRNFRNFLNAQFNFEAGVNTLIGENGVGKTNAFHALRLLIDESLPRNSTRLREEDFCRSLPSWKGHWIVISLFFEKLDPSEGCQLLKHETGHMDGSATGTYTLYFRPRDEVRKKLFELSKGDKKQAIAHLEKITISDYEPVLAGRGTANLLDNATYEKWVGDFTAGVFPDPGDDDESLLGVRVPSIHQEVACTFIKALRDVIAELQSYRGNPLLNLLRGLESEIEIAESEKITGAISELNKNISSLDEIKALSSGIQSALHNAVGHTFSPDISIESSLPDSLDKLLQRLGILVGDSASPGYKGELAEQSLGSANLIYLALKFLEYQRKLSTNRAAHFLLIEEPEAHLHAHIQKTLFNNLGPTETQVIVSTHSTQISSIAKVESVNVLARKHAHCEVYQPASGLDPKTRMRVARYIDAVRSTLLFAKGVVLVEGEAELIMIPAMVKAVFGVGVDELGISVIAMDSAFFEHVSVIFAEQRIKRHCAIISDLDASTIKLPADATKDTADQKKARASQEAGLQRREALATLTTGNPWLSYFLAAHTFEVDFLTAGNDWEVEQTLEEIYDQQAAIDGATAKLQSADVSVCGPEILRLAKKEGKGWFALLLAETLFERTVIPNYIVNALAFACQDIVTDSTIKQIGLYRIRKMEAGFSIPNGMKEKVSDLAKLPPSEFVTAYLMGAPDDQLSHFYNQLEGYRIGL